MRQSNNILRLITLALVGVMSQTTLAVCPFCDSVAQTLSEEMATVDVVVVAELLKRPPVVDDDSDEVPKATFKIVEILNGKKYLTAIKTLDTIYFGDAKLGTKFMVTGVDPPTLAWSTPLEISSTAVKYLKTLPSLPKSGQKRLEHFVDFLEHKDDMLARDSYDEFAKAPYDVVQTVKAKLPHDKLVRWVQDFDIPASRRRLYLTLLGVCGSGKDLKLLENLLKSDNPKSKAGLDALSACYLTLKGEPGLKLLEDLFLKNKKSDYADTYAVIMALRFHGTEGKVLKRKRILKSLHFMLDRPDLADLVIPDLSRWEDWSQIDRLVGLFKNADEKTSWVRVPVINYLRQCPLPIAKKRIKELEKIDPSAIKRANTFFPFGGGGAPADPDQKGAKSPQSPGSTSTGSTPSAPGSTAPDSPDTNSSTRLFEMNNLLAWAVPMGLGIVLLGASAFLSK